MRARRNGLALAALLALAGCADRIGDYPALLPTDELLAEPDLPAHAADAATSDAGVAGGLQGRASGLASRVPAPAASDEDLTARADALRDRAAELSNTSLDACPPGAPCDEPAPASGTEEPPAGN